MYLEEEEKIRNSDKQRLKERKGERYSSEKNGKISRISFSNREKERESVRVPFCVFVFLCICVFYVSQEKKAKAKSFEREGGVRRVLVLESILCTSEIWVGGFKARNVQEHVREFVMPLIEDL